jgi:hypothetical protein
MITIFIYPLVENHPFLAINKNGLKNYQPHLMHIVHESHGHD